MPRFRHFNYFAIPPYAESVGIVAQPRLVRVNRLANTYPTQFRKFTSMDNNTLLNPANPQTTQPQPGNEQPESNTSKDAVPKPAPIPPQDSTNARVALPVDKICWQSDDGLVVIKQLVTQAQKFPPSPYPCVVMQGYPKEHERVRRIPGGGIEIMLTHEEMESFIDAFNDVAENQGKGKLYQILQRIPPKPAWRKNHWRRLNQERLSARHFPGPTPRWSPR